MDDGVILIHINLHTYLKSQTVQIFVSSINFVFEFKIQLWTKYQYHYVTI